MRAFFHRLVSEGAVLLLTDFEKQRPWADEGAVVVFVYFWGRSGTATIPKLSEFGTLGCGAGSASCASAPESQLDSTRTSSSLLSAASF